MKIHTEILGNLESPLWHGRAAGCDVEFVDLDQWTAQKSRFVVRGDRGGEYAVALRRHTQLADGDIIEYDPEQGRIVALRIRLRDVMVVGLDRLARLAPEEAIRRAVELGHAVGNQHWPAVVRGLRLYVPLTVDRRVMESVMRTHRFEQISVSFCPGSEVIPYLAPHEIRRLFGGADSAAEHLHHHEPVPGAACRPDGEPGSGHPCPRRHEPEPVR